MIMNIVSTLTRKCVSKMEPKLQNYDDELLQAVSVLLGVFLAQYAFHTLSKE